MSSISRTCLVLSIFLPALVAGAGSSPSTAPTGPHSPGTPAMPKAGTYQDSTRFGLEAAYSLASGPGPLSEEQEIRVWKHIREVPYSEDAPEFETFLATGDSRSRVAFLLERIQGLSFNEQRAVLRFIHKRGAAHFCGEIRSALRPSWDFVLGDSGSRITEPSSTIVEYLASVSRDCSEKSGLKQLSRWISNGDSSEFSWSLEILQDLGWTLPDAAGIAHHLLSLESASGRGQGLRLVRELRIHGVGSELRALLGDDREYSLPRPGTCVYYGDRVSSAAKSVLEGLAPSTGSAAKEQPQN